MLYKGACISNEVSKGRLVTNKFKTSAATDGTALSIFDEFIISDNEIAEMSAALVRKFGTEAINMAAFFLDEHLELEDQERAESWLRVMACLDETYHQSLTETVMH